MAGSQGDHGVSLRTTALLLAVSFVASESVCPSAHGTDSSPQARAEPQLILRGQVLSPDGSPAIGATVSSLKQAAGDEPTTRTDGDGRFEIVDQFATDARIHVTSADGSTQATWRAPAMYARTMFQKPHEIRLQPSTPLRVSVRSNRKGVEGAWVVAQGIGAGFRATGQTNARGEADLQVPAQVRLDSVSAWHADRGVAAARFEDLQQTPASMELELAPPRSQSFRVLDPAGEPVSGVPIVLNPFFHGGRKSFPGGLVLVSQLRSDADGTGTATWFPREHGGVHVTLNHPNWILDQSWHKEVADGIKTMTIRPKHVVRGKLELPKGVNGTGLLIQARGVGPSNALDTAQTRAQPDGSFSLKICAQYRYWISVVDLEWASDHWTGQILTGEEATPTAISLPVYRATPIEVHVTRGPQKRPIEAAQIELSGLHQMDWTDEKGNSHTGSLGMHQWVRTDEHGIARIATGKGHFQIRLSSNSWDESRSLKVSNDPVTPIEFHRPWEANRPITGRAALGGAGFVPNAGTYIKVWGTNSTAPSGMPVLTTTPEVDANGHFRASVDGDLVTAFIHDREQSVAGIATVGTETNHLEIALSRNGSLSGSLTDRGRLPVAGVELDLQLMTTQKVTRPGGFIDFVNGPVISVGVNCVTDARGSFHFSDVPTDVPLRMRVIKTGGAKGWINYEQEFRLKPGERREDERVRFNSP